MLTLRMALNQDLLLIKDVGFYLTFALGAIRFCSYCNDTSTVIRYSPRTVSILIIQHRPLGFLLIDLYRINNIGSR